ncbi:Potassium channel subfamily K member 13-like protein [Leptotrombidium deliense]|uniref:Potassium channel subfamily K member 13-like protein n=1 Tax=Leptotrombidium deliense TaxID=299467 RepID=A0A443SBA5_9ACAR|nr:Potassium channel subfamily K member 13-like protein [Leptotrombidium deliense]
MCSGGCLVNDHTCTGTLTRSGHTHSTPHSTLLRNEHRHHHNDHINSDVTGVQLCLPNNTSVHDYHSQHQQQQVQQQPEKHSRRKKLAVPVILCLLLICGYIVFGAAIISVLEGWTILDGSYFCFLALSTIGFGGLNADSTLFAKTANYERKLIFLCGYVLTGMALIAMCFTLIQHQIVFRLKRCKRNFGVKDEDIYDEDDETIAALQNTAQLVENTEDFDV